MTSGLFATVPPATAAFAPAAAPVPPATPTTVAAPTPVTTPAATVAAVALVATGHAIGQATGQGQGEIKAVSEGTALGLPRVQEMILYLIQARIYMIDILRNEAPIYDNSQGVPTMCARIDKNTVCPCEVLKTLHDNCIEVSGYVHHLQAYMEAAQRLLGASLVRIGVDEHVLDRTKKLRDIRLNECIDLFGQSPFAEIVTNYL